MAKVRVEVYQDEAGEWRWRRWSGSDVVADSAEGYVNRGHAVDMAFEHNPGADVYLPHSPPEEDE